MLYLSIPISFLRLACFFLPLHFEHPTLLSAFYGYRKNRLEFVGYGKYVISIDYSRFLCIENDIHFHYSSYLQTVIANVNNRSLHYTYLRTVMYRYVYVMLYVYVTCLIY